MEGLSKEDFEKAMARLKEFKEILSQFENRESCVECLGGGDGALPRRMRAGVRFLYADGPFRPSAGNQVRAEKR